MQKLIRFIAPALWILAAMFVFPAFAPNGYNAFLFGGRLAVSVLFLVLAYVAFRTPDWFKAHLVTGLVGLGVANYIADAGYNLIPPSESHLRTLVEQKLASQGAEVVAEHTNLGISGMKCTDWSRDWECEISLSYKTASTNEAHENELLNIRYDKGTGENFEGPLVRGCEFEFQWSRRLRASSYYTPEMEPLAWSRCHVNNGNTAYLRQLDGNGVKGVSFILPQNDKSAQLTIEPLSLGYAEGMVKDYYEGGAKNIECNYASLNPLEVRCAVSGTKTIWEGKVASMADPFGSDTTQVQGSFRETVRIVPEGGRWRIAR